MRQYWRACHDYCRVQCPARCGASLLPPEHAGRAYSARLLTLVCGSRPGLLHAVLRHSHLLLSQCQGKMKENRKYVDFASFA